MIQDWTIVVTALNDGSTTRVIVSIAIWTDGVTELTPTSIANRDAQSATVANDSQIGWIVEVTK